MSEVQTSPEHVNTLRKFSAVTIDMSGAWHSGTVGELVALDDSAGTAVVRFNGRGTVSVPVSIVRPVSQREVTGRHLLSEARDMIQQARTERLYPFDRNSPAYHALNLRLAGRYRRAALDALNGA